MGPKFEDHIKDLKKTPVDLVDNPSDIIKGYDTETDACSDSPKAEDATKIKIYVIADDLDNNKNLWMMMVTMFSLNLRNTQFCPKKGLGNQPKGLQG